MPDVNVWLALLNEQHVHHAAAVSYWEGGASSRVFLCRISLLGVLRVSTNKVAMGGTPYTIKQAWQAVQGVVDLPEVGFQAEPDGVDPVMRQFTNHSKFRADDWTDAYLAALAKQANLRVVTFDRGFAQYAGLSLLML